MSEAGVPAGKVSCTPKMLNDPQSKARDATVDVPTEQWPDLKIQIVSPKLTKAHGEIRWARNSTLGVHNQEVYGDELAAEGLVARFRGEGSHVTYQYKPQLVRAPLVGMLDGLYIPERIQYMMELGVDS